ncbi:Uncharacterized protein DAT39_005402 [Clarias magur]|uniref:Uncharacterized protein n=1 Tax=Clarias magur TaxID=1594786 RepID=A0A8J4UV87_CLAMG|nr:Uncharacterized protein DAT39_005402 [Clarias magur]
MSTHTERDTRRGSHESVLNGERERDGGGVTEEQNTGLMDLGLNSVTEDVERRGSD